MICVFASDLYTDTRRAVAAFTGHGVRRDTTSGHAGLEDAVDLLGSHAHRHVVPGDDV